MLRRALYLAQMLRNESRTPTALRADQAQQVTDLVRHAAAQVPFYRDLYGAHGISMAAFQGLDDLPLLPIVTKQDLRAAGAAARAMDAPHERVNIRTSGSSGEPFKFQIDPRYDQWRKAQCLRPYLSTGQSLWDKVFRITAVPRQHQPWFSKLGLLRERHVASTDKPEQIVQAWREFSPDVLQGYPSVLRPLAHFCLESDQRLQPAPRMVYSDSELLLPDARRLIEYAFGAPVTDVFGTFETDNIAFQCEMRDGYHVTNDCVVLEIVRDGKPAAMEEEGDMVVTVLRNHAQPFIRYSLGDIGRLSARSCPCGRPFPLLTVIDGRANDQIVLADGRRITPAWIFAKVGPFVDSIRLYQLQQLDIGHFRLLIEPYTGYQDVDRGGIVAALRGVLGEAVIEVQVQHIARDPSGKRRFFTSRLGPGRSDAAAVGFGDPN